MVYFHEFYGRDLQKQPNIVMLVLVWSCIRINDRDVHTEWSTYENIKGLGYSRIIWSLDEYNTRQYRIGRCFSDNGLIPVISSCILCP